MLRGSVGVEAARSPALIIGMPSSVPATVDASGVLVAICAMTASAVRGVGWLKSDFVLMLSCSAVLTLFSNVLARFVHVRFRGLERIVTLPAKYIDN